MPAYFCARLLVIAIVESAKPRKRNTCDYPFVLIRAGDHQEAFERALKLGRQHETTYKNNRGQKVRWVFVRVEEIRQLSRFLDGVEVGSLLDVFASDEPISIRKRFHPSKYQPLFS